ncbi:TATA-binding protein-associated factor mot1 [Exophiala xenobiotica]|nr:TATA-binding protein-associated factor mot1 [Exophiala xenobiotica]
MAASRLDRLVTLLDKGSTQLIRNTAAQQLADVQKQNPDNLFALLGRVLPYLQSKSWDTRTAAAKAIGGIVENAEKFDPNADDAGAKVEAIKAENQSVKLEDKPSDGDDLLQLAALDIKMILKYGKKLLGSAGKEYEYSMAGMTPAQRLAHQKQNLTARLGLGGEYMEEDLVTEHDFAAGAQAKGAQTPALSRVDTKSAVARQDSVSTSSPFSALSPSENNGHALSEESGLSKRQLNQLKRKNKSAAKAGSSKMRVVDLSGRRPSEPGEAVPEKPLIQPDEEHSHDWPFDVMCDFLSIDLFDPTWEIRHGAAMGLREVLRVHGRGAGRRYGRSRDENDRANRRWLDDLACRLLCVLMLDRFGDYVSDTVVAPIRESIGQTLGALLTQLPDDTAISVYTFLQQMINQTDTGLKQPIWEVCHGGMIGLRYFVAVRKDLLLQQPDLIDGVVSAVIRGLVHPDDDVKSVSAATLVPIAGELTAMRPDSLGQLISVVWDCLLDMQDDLSASTGAVMDLLATLCSYEQVLEAMRKNAEEDPEQSFESLLPRLYFFLRHTITSVRMAVLKALATFLTLSNPSNMGWVGGRVTRLIFQNMLLERNEGVLWKSYEVWQGLVTFMVNQGLEHFVSSLEPHIMPMIMATVQPIGQARSPIPMDASLLIKPSGAPMAAISSKHRNTPDSDQQPKKKRKLEKSESNQQLSHNTDGHMLHGEVDLVGVDVMLRTRIACSQALGLLLGRQHESMIDAYWTSLVPTITSTNSSSRLFAAMILEEIAKNQSTKPSKTPAILVEMQKVLDEDGNYWYSDIVSSLQAARGQCQSLISAFQNNAHVPRDRLPAIAVVCQGDSGAGPKAFSLSDAERIVTTDFDRLLKGLTPAQRVSGTQYLNDARANAQTAVGEARKVKESRDLAIKATVASVFIRLGEIPKKPGQLIKSIMDSIKGEEYEDLQARSASAVAGLIDFYTASPKRGPVDKLVSNLVKFTCVDTSETPEFPPNGPFEDVAPEMRRMPSLIVCPPTLSGHWQQEIKQYAPFLKCVAYVGSPTERSSRRHLLEAADVVVTSYDVCRNDNDILTPLTWNYCVLDEGHLIKNPKAKITQAVKKIISNHRLILSGTPIQNNVLELWSLFDFLMPGFLGTEKVFQDRFAKPIAASRNAKSSSKEQEAGALAIEALHKQVLPFLLRRLKEEVLNDLPPKIIQNYYCDLSDLQKRLFEDFFKKERKTVESSVGSSDKESKQHIFQALQYMRKLCNSPAMVVKEGNKQYDAIQKQLAVSKSNLRDVAHAPKLSALRDLLVDCGIGVSSDSNDVSASNYVSQHRALIFCQMKEMLDMVQNEVLAKLLPSVQFLRLDGSVEATKRQNIVNQFNNDPSYDCLLLTTSVGGLGLNLTGADTVIFVEHDWNPQKDIQAMDRAHRIGQKKVVNVYRLITRGTLEEKIMNLQRFKIDVASTVVNQQNAGLGSMETDQILDLFNLGETSDTGGGESATGGKDEDMLDTATGEIKKKGEKGWLDDVGELWDERQYEEEFNLDSFVQNLQK